MSAYVEDNEGMKCYCLEGNSFSLCILTSLNSEPDPLGLCLTKKLSNVTECIFLILQPQYIIREVLCLENMFLNQVCVQK